MELIASETFSKLNLLAEDWNRRRLSEGIHLLSGQHILENLVNDKGLGVPYITGPANFPNGIIETTKFTNHPQTVCQAGDILVTVKGSGTGKMTVADRSYCISRQLMAVRVNGDWDSQYLYHLLQANSTHFSGASAGLIPGISRDDILNLEIRMPRKKAEQTAIATALSDADALINSLEKLIEKKRLIKQGVMQELLRPKVGFQNGRLGEYIDRFVGGGTPPRSNPSYWNGDIPWMTVKDFATFDKARTQESITKEGLKNSATNLIPKGTLITSTRMALGKAVVYDVDVAINQDLKALFPKRTTLTQYIYYWFEYNTPIIEKLGSGSTVMGLSLADLSALSFYNPPLQEQVKICQLLKDIDVELESLEQKLVKYRMIKQGMMQELLTGKTRFAIP